MAVLSGREFGTLIGPWQRQWCRHLRYGARESGPMNGVIRIRCALRFQLGPDR